MARSASLAAVPSASAMLELLKPITWFPPMWAYACGLVSSGAPLSTNWQGAIAGLLVAGPLVCGTSQAVNDWFDRHVDAINEPGRPIPSGRVPGTWGLAIAVAWTMVSIAVATLLGPWGFVAALVGLAFAWAYSAPPIRLKRNGWWGNSAVAVSYEGIPWFTGAAVMTLAFPDWRIVVIAALYSIGAHGIMTLNDFKSVAGDRRTGVNSLPVLLGVDRAARLACVVMAVPQVAVVSLLFAWGRPTFAVAIGALIILQLFFMQRLLAAPRERAAWYNATGVTAYVAGMLIVAFALRGMAG